MQVVGVTSSFADVPFLPTIIILVRTNNTAHVEDMRRSAPQKLHAGIDLLHRDIRLKREVGVNSRLLNSEIVTWNVRTISRVRIKPKKYYQYLLE